jgi:hypothetical protein
MIKEVKMFTMICDNCGKDLCENEEFAAWNDISPLSDIADGSDWNTEKENHYCPDCYFYDENDELVIIKKEA